MTTKTTTKTPAATKASPARERLFSPEEFKSEVQRRGWTYRALAQRWNVGETYVSKVARDPDRSPHWDDAVRGLPLVKIVPKK